MSAPILTTAAVLTGFTEDGGIYVTYHYSDNSSFQTPVPLDGAVTIAAIEAKVRANVAGPNHEEDAMEITWTFEYEDPEGGE